MPDNGAMKVQYKRGQHVISAERLDDIIAAQTPPDDAGAREEARGLGDALATEASALATTEEQTAAFHKAGWSFLRGKDAAIEAVRTSRARSQFPRQADVGEVFRDAAGRIMVNAGELTVKFDPEHDDNYCRAILADVGGEVVRPLRFSKNLYEVRAVEGANAIALSNALDSRDDVSYAEPTMIEHIPERLAPNDPRYSEQWQWNNTGQTGGTAGADISAEQAWTVTRGGGATVAVIDNGFDVAHEDLRDGLHPNTGYFRADRTYAAMLSGYPGSFHGTFCAGMSGARWNNSIGVVGSAPECRLQLIAALNDQVGAQVTLARAVALAADPTVEMPDADPRTRADVISCSLGPNGAPFELTAVLRDAIEFAARSGREGRGCPIFWATDNQDVPVSMDDVCSHPDVIAVGRSTARDTHDNSAHGPELDFLAPGVEVFSTAPGNAYTTGVGTSYAAPASAGVCALLVSADPAISASDVRRALRESCEKIGADPYVGGRNDRHGFGRVDARRALKAARGSVLT